MTWTSPLRSALGLTLLAAGLPASAGTWTTTSSAPAFDASTMLQLTDGRILINAEFAPDWYVWAPDAFGSYANGTFTQVASAHWNRLYYASGVFADGRVIVAGGEYGDFGFEINNTEIYDPVADVWTEISPPPGWANIGDAPNVILADGRFFLGSIFDSRTALLDPATLLWTAGPNAPNSRLTEETWILLPEGTALKWHCFEHPGSAKYDPTSNAWINCGSTPVDLVLPASYETGAAVLLPDGRTFCIGGTPHTALYTQGAGATDAGSWAVGPNTPLIGGRTIGAEDAPAAFLPNGDVLCCFGPVTSGGGTFESPTYFFEYDAASNSLFRIADPLDANDVPYRGHMLVLPTGEVAWCNGHHRMQLYAGSGAFDPAWRPTITDVATQLERGVAHTLSGTQLNGVTNGSSYGDECYTATNYPLVRVTSLATGKVAYARTFDHSTMAVQTESAIVSTHFVLAASVPAGQYELEAVASGIPSEAVLVSVNDSLDATSYSILKGVPRGGGLGSLAQSDDSYLRVGVQPVASRQEPPVQVEFSTTSTIASPNALSVSLETSVTSANVTRAVSFYNVVTNQYDLVDTAPASTTDETSVITVTSGASNYVSPSTSAVRVKVAFGKQATSPVGFWEARFDEVHFLVN